MVVLVLAVQFVQAEMQRLLLSDIGEPLMAVTALAASVQVLMLMPSHDTEVDDTLNDADFAGV